MGNDREVEILLIEDDPNDVELTLRALKKINLENKVKVLSDGAEAIDYLFLKGKYSDNPPHVKPKLIMLDLKLPKIDGKEVLQKLKDNPETKSIPVVVLTSSKEETDLIKSYELGVNSYIVKPVDFESFLESVTKIGYYWVILNQKPH